MKMYQAIGVKERCTSIGSFYQKMVDNLAYKSKKEVNDRIKYLSAEYREYDWTVHEIEAYT